MSKEIKVGQIYEEPDEYGFKYIITKVSARNHDGFVEKVYDAICNDGEVFSDLSEKAIKTDEFVAEYPTWQEAINSKEFNNETI